MASLTLELPDDLLAEVSRLAQEFNVPRNDVFRRAIAALARAGELEAKMDRLSTLHAEAASYRQSLTTRM
ncbi:MAG: ribbon-helix-helix protein, CopG family, partial [bacterium]